MLLLHQTGTVKVGEVVRYTITYTPAQDRILPAPAELYLKIKNASAVAFRAAFIHGPYTLYVSAEPAGFKPDRKLENPRRDGVPEFEPNLKAGSSWTSTLKVPDAVRRSAGTAKSTLQSANGEEEERCDSVTWVIEVASQVIFSTSASVNYEVLLGRDENSINVGLGGSLTGKATPQHVPGRVSDFQQSSAAKDGHHPAQPKGVFSRAIHLKVEDTASLWNNPNLPEWEDKGAVRPTEKEKLADEGKDVPQDKEELKKKRKRVHLVILTHGLHSNLGADMLYLKESIDAGHREAREQRKAEKAKAKAEKAACSASEGSSSKSTKAESVKDGYLPGDSQTTLGGAGEEAKPNQNNWDEDSDEEDEEVVVRGFSGNAVRTEKGIKYLGKRLAKYVLGMTYPDQPFRPVKPTKKGFKNAIMPHAATDGAPGVPAHDHSSIKKPHLHHKEERPLAYQVTSISFIGHSLGGLIQMYAVAYIQKHSPEFFDKIKGINFIALASPFLGLSNENPLYVKFALDFGLVGRTGQDLGLTWRAPILARSSMHKWTSLVNSIGDKTSQTAGQPRDPRSKPLLRILPTGPAHVALKKFRNRTVYSNVVNDGIVPLRTSCLLFLDWQGLGRVEKARRENGLVGTMAGWGWAEITGQNATATARQKWLEEAKMVEEEPEDMESNTPTRQGRGEQVPQPEDDVIDDDVRSLKSLRVSTTTHGDKDQNREGEAVADASTKGPFEQLIEFLTPKSMRDSNLTKPLKPIYKRSQTMMSNEGEGENSNTNGDSADPQGSSAPPKTSFFESAGDILNPPLPPLSFIIDPTSRPRAIFHDRVYHPEDIPPPPQKRRTGSILKRRPSDNNSSKTSQAASTATPDSPTPAVHRTDTNRSISTTTSTEIGTMKVEEKIARAYHRDLSWRKVLVSLEPDAHNNIIVRRKFANAYGWPVVKHLVDTHFSNSEAATMPDHLEDNNERAKSQSQGPDVDGSEVKKAGSRGRDDPARLAQHEPAPHQFLNLAHRKPPPLSISTSKSPAEPVASSKDSTHTDHDRSTTRESTVDSAEWSERDFMDSEGETDDEVNLSLYSPGFGHDGTHSPEEISKDQFLTKVESSGSGAGLSSKGWKWTEAIVGRGSHVGAHGGPAALPDRTRRGLSRERKAGEGRKRDVDVITTGTGEVTTVERPRSGEGLSGSDSDVTIHQLL